MAEAEHRGLWGCAHHFHCSPRELVFLQVQPKPPTARASGDNPHGRKELQSRD